MDPGRQPVGPSPSREPATPSGSKSIGGAADTLTADDLAEINDAAAPFQPTDDGYPGAMQRLIDP
jgi:hypothetical protein